MDKLQLFSLHTLATFFEAAPFLLMGALLASFFEVYVSAETIKKILPKKVSLGLLAGVLLGIIFPTCECGIVPIVKKMLDKKIPGHIAITYMLAAPVINPIVLFSTFIAFRGNWFMVLSRVGLVAIIALIIGWYFSRKLSQDIQVTHHTSHIQACTCGCIHEYLDHHTQIPSRLQQIISHATVEFLDMSKFLILGCFAAAAFKTFFPREIIMFFQTNPLLAIVFMMILAIVLSVCANADSFIAASFTRMPQAAQMAFITIGPMFDLKLLAMYFNIFNKKTIFKIVFMIISLNLLLNYIWGIVWK